MRAGRRRWGERPAVFSCATDLRRYLIRPLHVGGRIINGTPHCAHGAVVRLDICFCGAIRKTEIAASVIVALGRSNDVARLKVLIDLTRSRDGAWRDTHRERRAAMRCRPQKVAMG